MTSEQAPEPTIDEAFAERYRAIMQEWQSGEVSAKSAKTALETLLEESVDEGNLMNQGGVELNIGIIEGYLANFVDSARHFENARQHFGSAGARSQVITCDLNIGEVYRLQGNFTRAQMFFHRAYDEAKELNNPRTMAVALTNEGQMCLSAGSYRKSRDCLDEAIEIAKIPYPDEDNERIYLSRIGVLAEIYHALTQIALVEDNAEAAWLYARQSYNYGVETAHPMRMGYGNRAIADVISALGKSPAPEFQNDPDFYYKEALSNFKAVKMEGDIAKTLYARGNSLARRGKRSAAAKLYQRALAIFTRLGMTADATGVAEAQMRATSEIPKI